MDQDRSREYLDHARDTGLRCIRYIEGFCYPLPGVAKSYAEEAAWYAFQARPELREDHQLLKER